MSMKLLTLEFPYQELWRRVFGPNYDRVEILEAVKSLKCDFEGLTIICRLRFKDKRMKAADLVGKGAIRNVETLYCDKDGSLTLFIQGRPVVYVPKQMRVTDSKVSRPGLAAGPPEFVDTDRMRLQLLCKDEEVPKILDFYDKIQLPHRLVEVSRFESSSYTDLSRLTLKQRQALLTAYSLGYYDVPRENFFRAVGEVPQAGNLYLRRAPKKGRERIAFQRPLAINPTMDSNDRQPVDIAEVTRHLGYSVQQLSSPTSL